MAHISSHNSVYIHLKITSLYASLCLQILQKKPLFSPAPIQKRRLTLGPRNPLLHVPKFIQPEHKALHKQPSKLSILRSLKDLRISTPTLIDPETGTYDPFPNFPYPGELRAVYPLSPKRTLPDHIVRPDYARDGNPRSEQRARSNKIAILSKKEIEGMRKVCRLAREVLDIAAAYAKPGVTTDMIDEVVHNACIERDVSLPIRDGLPLYPGAS